VFESTSGQSESLTEPPLWRSPLLSQYPGLVHAVTKRGMNMALSVGPDIGGSAARRRGVCHALSIPFDRLSSGRQVHGTRIAVVTDELIGSGRDRSKPRIANVDGLVTNERDVPLMVLGADCGLVAVYDPQRHAVGVAHAGWRGTAAGVIERLVGQMHDAFESRPGDLLAAISPCAGACCYEVGADVVSAFESRFDGSPGLLERRGDSTYLNLAAAISTRLRSAGVPADRIDHAGVCTICTAEFYSYRRDGRSTGQFALIASLR